MTRGDSLLVGQILGGVKFHQVYEKNADLAKSLAVFLTKVSVINKETFERRVQLEKTFYGDCREDVQEVRMMVDEAGRAVSSQQFAQIRSRLHELSDAFSKLSAYNSAYAELLKEEVECDASFSMDDIMSCDALVEGKTMDEIAVLSVICHK